jgi:signal transduction histidine kinase/ActR/RegA family two-component response regulator
VANDPSFIQDAAVEPTPTGDAATDRIARLERRLVREKRARLESEQLLESKSRELFERNAELRGLTLALEERVLERTAELASLKEFYEHVLDRLPAQLSVLSPSGVYMYANPAEVTDDALREWLIGRTDAEYGARTGISDEEVAVRAARMAAVTRDGCSVSYEETIATEPDHARYFQRVLAPVFGDDGGVRYLVNAGIEVTGERLAEERLRRSQKLEAIGLLAGGIAHDFNNLLTIIIGVTEALRETTPPSSSHSGLLDELLGATGQGAALTRQLLMFSRRTIIEPQLFDISEAIRGTESLIRRLLTERIQCVLVLGEPLPVRMDRSSLDQLLLNLAANARDAMPMGGQFTVFTRETILSPESAQAKGLTAARHVLIEVRDSGVGMSPEVLQRVFEPFFTTKPVSQGSGLGLASVYGIVTQSRGHVEVASVVGEGTTIRILLPLEESAVLPAASDTPAEVAPRGRGRVLVVDDESGVRMVTTNLLRRLGYDVVEASGGVEALRVAEAAHGTIDLLISDVRMPGINGFELAIALRATDPSLDVLLMSGYVDDADLRDRIASSGIPLIEKPYRAAALGQQVTKVFEARRAGPAHAHTFSREQ